MSILVALEALNTSVFITIITAGLTIEVKILKTATATSTATSSTTWLKTTVVQRFSSTDKSVLSDSCFSFFSVRFIYSSINNPFRFSQWGSSALRAFKLVKKLSYESGKLPVTYSIGLTSWAHNLLERFKPIEHSLDIYSLTYAVSQFTRTSARKQQNSSNISKTTCQELANEKRSLNSINCHNPNTTNSTYHWGMYRKLRNYTNHEEKKSQVKIFLSDDERRQG